MNLNLKGEQVSRLIINESKQFAFEQKETDFKQNHINLNHELEMLIEKLVNSIKLPQTEENIFFVARIGKQLNEKLYILNTYLNKCLVEQVVDDFLDIHSPIKKLTDIVMSNENQGLNFIIIIVIIYYRKLSLIELFQIHKF